MHVRLRCMVTIPRQHLLLIHVPRYTTRGLREINEMVHGLLQLMHLLVLVLSR